MIRRQKNNRQKKMFRLVFQRLRKVVINLNKEKKKWKIKNLIDKRTIRMLKEEKAINAIMEEGKFLELN